MDESGSLRDHGGGVPTVFAHSFALAAHTIDAKKAAFDWPPDDRRLKSSLTGSLKMGSPSSLPPAKRTRLNRFLRNPIRCAPEAPSPTLGPIRSYVLAYIVSDPAISNPSSSANDRRPVPKIGVSFAKPPKAATARRRVVELTRGRLFVERERTSTTHEHAPTRVEPNGRAQREFRAIVQTGSLSERHKTKRARHHLDTHRRSWIRRWFEVFLGGHWNRYRGADHHDHQGKRNSHPPRYAAMMTAQRSCDERSLRRDVRFLLLHADPGSCDN